MKKLNNTMFQSIKDALNNEDTSNSGHFNDILKLETGNTYTLRLLPNLKNPEKTFYHYFQHGWESYATGQYVSALSPTTWGERDPIAEERYRIWKTGTPTEKSKMSAVKRLEKWLVNVYVIDDPTNPENNGKVKILRYGAQVQKIIKEAIEGERAEEFGAKIFDLGPDGVNLKVKIEQQGDWPTYTGSYFTSIGKLSLTDEQQEAILDQLIDLDTLFPVKTYDELQQMLDEHYYVRIKSTPQSNDTEIVSGDNEEEENVVSETVNVSNDNEEDLLDEDMRELLKDL
jgi:hypothetical protein